VTVTMTIRVFGVVVGIRVGGFLGHGRGRSTKLGARTVGRRGRGRRGNGLVRGEQW